MNELKRIAARGVERLNRDAAAGLPCLPSPFDYLTDAERARLHELKMQLPTYAEERQAARERLRRKRYKRKSS